MSREASGTSRFGEPPPEERRLGGSIGWPARRSLAIPCLRGRKPVSSTSPRRHLPGRGAGHRERWALRVHREGYHPRAAIASELTWIDALRRDGVAVTPTPLPGMDGELIQTVSHETLGRSRHVVLFAWKPARSRTRIGRTSATGSRHWARWPRGCTSTCGAGEGPGASSASPGTSTPCWAAALAGDGGATAWGSGRRRKRCSRGPFALIARRLRAFGTAPDRFNLIHGDMRLANLLIDGEPPS